MSAKASPVGLLLLTALFMLAFSVPAAADTQDIIQPQTPESSDSGFQAGTCTADSEAGKRCSVETPGIFFKTAAGHPPIGFTQYTIEHEPYTPLPSPPFPPGSLLAEIPGEDIKEHTIRTLRSDLPPGLTVNPEATPSRCPLASFLNQPVPGTFVPTCDASTQTGTQKITLVTNKNEVEIAPGFKPPEGFVIPPIPGGTEIPIYNLVPAEGEPAKLGFVVNAKIPVFLTTQVAWENDFHESFTIALLNTAEASGLSTLISRLVTNGAITGNGTYLTNPTTCFDPNLSEFEHLYSTWFRAESHADPANPNFPAGVTAVEGPLPKVPPNTGQRVQQEGCDTVPFDPSIEADPGTNNVDSPAATTVTAKLPFDPVTEGGAANQSQSHVRRAEISLPEGMGLNPSGSNGLVACTDAQFKKGERVQTNECPPASVIGTVEIDSPPLAEPLEGEVYVGEQKSQDPQSGELFRILIEAKSAHEGIFARLVGNLKANPDTGELTTVLTDKIVGQFAGTLPDGLPQVPFESVTLRIDDSAEVLTSPPTCGPNETTSVQEPWSTPASTKTPTSSFTLTNLPGGGACPQTLAERPFGPGFLAGTRNTQAGAYSTFDLGMHRGDGAQEFRRVDVTLPPGMSAKLRGVEYCPEANVSMAAGRTGKSELAAPSCPANSLVGSVNIDAGSGSNPLNNPGKVYFAGPYKGAPVSLVFVTPAVAGPFDLGVVVVRTALNVDPETAVVRAVSDPIPYVFGGVKLDVRSIVVNIDRQGYTVNPTTCREQSSVNADIFGGAGDPDDPAAWSLVKQDHTFRATGCRALKFKPKFYARILGGKKQTRRTANPKFRTVLKAREGDANLRRAAFILPRATILDQSHIQTVCTRVQLAANSCPKQAVYGKAKATSPLLDGRLQGPVYLTSSDNQLPDLLVDLRGQVNVRLRGVISSKNGRLKTVFRTTPDVAVKQFTLEMEGGDQGLLVNSQNLCGKTRTGFLNLKAQNSRQVKSKKLRLNIPACSKGKKK